MRCSFTHIGPASKVMLGVRKSDIFSPRKIKVSFCQKKVLLSKYEITATLRNNLWWCCRVNKKHFHKISNSMFQKV